MGASEEIDAADALETETCIGCGLSVEVDNPVFLEWDADIVGLSVCPDCRLPTACGDPEESPHRRAA